MQTAGLQATNKRGEVVFIVMTVLSLSAIADFLNFADPIGTVKRLANKALPSVFGPDKFRTATKMNS